MYFSSRPISGCVFVCRTRSFLVENTPAAQRPHCQGRSIEGRLVENMPWSAVVRGGKGKMVAGGVLVEEGREKKYNNIR